MSRQRSLLTGFAFLLLVALGVALFRSPEPVKAAPEEQTRQLLTTTVNLEKENQEITAFRFRLDGNGTLDRGSVHSLQKSLRTAGSG